MINHDPGREKNKNVFWSTSKCVRERHSLRQFLSPWKSFILCPFKIYLSKSIWALFQIDKDCFLFASLTDRFQRWTSCYFLLGTSVKLCVELIVFELLYITTLLSGIHLGEAPNYSCFKVFRGLCFLKQSRYLMTLEVLKIVSISILEHVHWVSIRNIFDEK